MTVMQTRSDPVELLTIERPAKTDLASASKDDEFLARTGKRPVLKRNFGFLSILGFSLLVLSTWIGTFVILGQGLQNGGPAGLVYSFIFVWVGNLATFTSLAELASMAPTSGGQYHWVSILAPRSSQAVLSYVTGWLTVCGWQTSVASSAYVTGTLFQGFIQILDPAYHAQLWHGTLLAYGSLIMACLATSLAGAYLPRLESFLLVFYILGFFAVLVPLVYLGPHADAAAVFTQFINDGGWPTQTLSFFVGISGNAFAFLGADSVYHMSEEIRDAATTVPKSMVWSLVINGVVGLSMYIALLFCAGDFQDALTSGYVYPFIEVLLQATRSRAGSATMTAVIIVVDLGLVIGVTAASSRMLWSFARDKGVPFWRQMMRVHRTTSVPLNAIYITIVVSVLLLLISVGSPVAFNDVISLTVGSLYASYLMACGLLLWRRLHGSIRPYEHSLTQAINTPGSAGDLAWGPWRVKEPFGTVINLSACAYLIIVFFFSFWPPATPVQPDTMNYSCLVLGFVAIMSMLYYVLFARRVYTGPVIEEGL